MNNIDFHGIEEIWSSLSTSSLLWLTVTLAAYLFAQKLYKWSNWNSLLNPVAVSIVTVVILLMATHTPYQTYFSGAQFIHFLTSEFSWLKIGFRFYWDFLPAPLRLLLRQS